METAARVSAAKGPSDAIASRLADYFAHHVTEEAAHDQWLLDDMEVLGFARDEILARFPPAEVAEAGD